MKYFFDLDGTILDISKRYYFIYYDIIKKFGGVPLPKCVYWDYKRNKTPDDVILKRSNIPQFFFSKYTNIKQTFIESHQYLRFDNVWPELNDYIPKSKIFNKICLITFRKKNLQLLSQLKTLGISNWFENIVTVGSNNHKLDRYQIKADSIIKLFPNNVSGIFVGDTETDIKTGKLLGLKTVAVSFGIRDIKYLTHEDPDFVLNTPKELINFLSDLEKN